MSDKLVSPFPNLPEDDATYLHAKIPPHIFGYFFRQLLAGDRGCRQILVQIFFSKLYDQCKLDGIAAVYDPTNESRIAAIVGRLNFNEQSAVLGPERPARTRRSNKSAPKSPPQPTGSSDERAGTPDAGSET